ncbi:MAG TPA: DNA lyase [Pseudomonas sp.]|nr:DNA lyase [Pseudomonas sp.]
MRLWSLHPRYLDSKGLVALWREALLAQAVLADLTRGYRNHPQLRRFRQCDDPSSQIAAYLAEVHAEATARGYRFDASKIGRVEQAQPMPVNRGQLDYETRHLLAKLAVREPAKMLALAHGDPRPHPLFRVVEGGVAEWEIVTPPD